MADSTPAPLSGESAYQQLREWLRHPGWCAYIGSIDGDCSCGLDEAIAALRAQAPPDVLREARSLCPPHELYWDGSPAPPPEAPEPPADLVRSLLSEMESWRDIEQRENPKADAVDVLRVVISAIKSKMPAASPVPPPAPVEQEPPLVWVRALGLCPECGPVVRIDEDGCCAGCGDDVDLFDRPALLSRAAAPQDAAPAPMPERAYPIECNQSSNCRCAMCRTW